MAEVLRIHLNRGRYHGLRPFGTTRSTTDNRVGQTEDPEVKSSQEDLEGTGTNRETSGAQCSSGYRVCHKTDLKHEAAAGTAAGARMAAGAAAGAAPLSLHKRGGRFSR